MDKWKKLHTLIEWLEQGRELVQGDITYSISEDGNILHMIGEDKGVIVPTLAYVWNIIDRISEDDHALISAEIVLTKINL